MHGVLGATRNRTEARGAPFTLCPILPQRASVRTGSARCSAIFFAGETVRASLLRRAAFCTRNERAPPSPRQTHTCSKPPSASAANARLRQAAFHIRDELAFRARSKHKLAANRPPHPQQTSTRGKPPSVPAISRYFQKKRALQHRKRSQEPKCCIFDAKQALDDPGLSQQALRALTCRYKATIFWKYRRLAKREQAERATRKLLEASRRRKHENRMQTRNAAAGGGDRTPGGCRCPHSARARTRSAAGYR